MDALCGERHDILFFSEQKEYTLLPTLFINHLISDQRLIKGASSLWQCLFNFAKGNKDLITTVRYKKLAELLRKSTKTISRYVKSLKEHGYLDIRANYRDNGGKTVNTFCLQVPQEIINQLQLAPDRRKIKSTNAPSMPSEPKSIEPPVPAAKQIVLRETFKKVSSNFSCSHNKQQYPVETAPSIIPAEHYPLGNQLNIPDSSDTNIEDKSVHNPHDKNVSTINTESNIILINNSTVVVDQSTEELNDTPSTTPFDNNDDELYQKEIVSIDQKIEELECEEKLLLLQSQKKEPSDKVLLFQQRRALTQKINTLRSRKEMIQTTLKQRIQAQNNIDQLENQLLGEGPRQLSSHHIKRLTTALIELDIPTNKHQQLRQEIIYTIRFGSLVKSNQTQQAMTLGHSLNIALKILKEGRWETPTEMAGPLSLKQDLRRPNFVHSY